MTLENYIKNKLISKGADDVVVATHSSESSQIKFVNNQIVKTGTEQLQDISIFLAMNKKIAVTSLKDCSKKAADNMIKTLLNFIKNLPVNEEYYGIAEGPFKYKGISETYDKKIKDFNQVDVVEQAINKATEKSERSSGILEIDEISSSLTTSNNVESKEKGTSFYFSIRVFNKKGSGHKNHAGRMARSIQSEKAAEEASEIASLSQKQVRCPHGRYKVLFDPLAFAPILSNIGQAFSIFNVESGLSFFVNQLNNNVAFKNVTIYDDATYPNGLASTPFDSEGVPSKKNTMIKDGILKSYLHNTSTAKKYNTKTTANSGLISPEPTNTVIHPGKYSKEKLFSSIDKGLYITNTWYTRFNNMESGDFSTIPRDGIFIIKNGEITKAINNIRISENVLNMLKNISAIGKDQVQIRSWEAEHPTITPHLIVNNVNITKPR